MNSMAIIAGMPRAGTTYLYYNLQNHPSIYVSLMKETDYFCLNYSRGFEWYRHLYRKMGPAQVGFDISPLYFLFSDISIERIQKDLPEVKVILMVRKPTEWIVSLYYNILAQSSNNIEFEKFVEGYVGKKYGRDYRVCLGYGTIKKRVESFQSAFKDNLLLCDFGLVAENPLALFNAIEKFVSIERHFDNGNFSKAKINMSRKSGIDIIAKITMKKGFVDMANRFLPREPFLWIKKAIQYAQTAGKKTKSTIPTSTIEASEKMYGGDDQFVERLFSRGSMLKGNGQLYR